MMPNEYEAMAKAFMGTPQGAKVIHILDKISSAASTPSGRQLISMLAGSGGDALKNAARAAATVERDPARALLSTLLSTKDGAGLVAKVIELAGI